MRGIQGLEEKKKVTNSSILTSVGSSEEMKLAFSFAYSKLSQLNKK